MNPGAGRGSGSCEGSLEFFPLLQISRTSHPKGIAPRLLEGWGFGNQGDLGIREIGNQAVGNRKTQETGISGMGRLRNQGFGNRETREKGDIKESA